MEFYCFDFVCQFSSFDGRKPIIRCDGDNGNGPGININPFNAGKLNIFFILIVVNSFLVFRLRQAQVAKYYGFISTSHKLRTKDGYLLTLYNIWNSSEMPNGEVIFLQHGIVDTAFTWVLNLPHQSLGNNLNKVIFKRVT